MHLLVNTVAAAVCQWASERAEFAQGSRQNHGWARNRLPVKTGASHLVGLRSNGRWWFSECLLRCRCATSQNLCGAARDFAVLRSTNGQRKSSMLRQKTRRHTVARWMSRMLAVMALCTDCGSTRSPRSGECRGVCAGPGRTSLCPWLTDTTKLFTQGAGCVAAYKWW